MSNGLRKSMAAAVMVFAGYAAVFAEATAQAAETAKAAKGDLAIGLIAVAAALSVGLCALATGLAQSRIGAAGAGAIAEKPELSGTVILLVAIPETMIILGFVVAVVLVFML
jgi:V/A-type H+-transporting ATPase subunit K